MNRNKNGKGRLNFGDPTEFAIVKRTIFNGPGPWMGTQTRYTSMHKRDFLSVYDGSKGKLSPHRHLLRIFLRGESARFFLSEKRKNVSLGHYEHLEITQSAQRELHIFFFFFFLVSRKLKLSFVKISTLSVWSRLLFRETVYIYSQDDRAARSTQFRFFSFANGGCQLWIPFSPGPVLPVFSSSTFAVKKIGHFALQPMSRHRYLSNNVRYKGRL